MKCDLCGKTGGVNDFQDLIEKYKTGEVTVVCHSCISVANKELNRLRNVSSRWVGMRMKHFLGEQRKPKRKWWRLWT